MKKYILASTLLFGLCSGVFAKGYSYDSSNIEDLPAQCITLETVLSTTYNQYNMAYRGQRSLADADRVVGTEIEKAFLKGTPDEYLLNKNLQQFTMIKRNGLENEIARNRIYNLTGLMTRQELINIAKKMKKKAMNGGLTDKDYRMYDESVINDCLARVKKHPEGNSGSDYYKAIDYSKRKATK